MKLKPLEPRFKDQGIDYRPNDEDLTKMGGIAYPESPAPMTLRTFYIVYRHARPTASFLEVLAVMTLLNERFSEELTLSDFIDGASTTVNKNLAYS